MNDTNHEIVSQQNTETISKKAAFAYAAFGAFIAAILDTAVNNPSNCTKFGEAIVKIFSISNAFSADTLGVIFVIIVAAVLARINKFKTEKAAVMSGLMIFSTIALLTPIKTAEGFSSPQDVNNKVNNPIHKESFFLPNQNEYLATFANRYDLRLFVKTNEFVPNGTVLATHLRVSSCKPSYWGFLGLGSLIYNSLRTCPTDHVLKNGARVKILERWKTGARAYWYAKIEYQIGGEIHTGWIQAGWKENPWGFLNPDDKSGI